MNRGVEVIAIVADNQIKYDAYVRRLRGNQPIPVRFVRIRTREACLGARYYKVLHDPLSTETNEIYEYASLCQLGRPAH